MIDLIESGLVYSAFRKYSHHFFHILLLQRGIKMDLIKKKVNNLHKITSLILFF